MRAAMRGRGSLVGLFILRAAGAPPDGGPLLARIEGELYALVFSDRARADAARRFFGTTAAPFYVCDANREEVIRELRAAGAIRFLADYDPSSSTFANAGVV
jgi:hypothetical protein